MQRRSIRWISQHLTIHTTNAKSPINFHVDLLKVPSNFGYYTSRVTRMYNEDRWQTSILDLKPGQLVPLDVNEYQDIEEVEDIGYDFDNIELINEINRIKEPNYTPTSPPIDRTIFAFGVFDGHGGNECSMYLKDHLYENIERIHVTRKAFSDLKRFYNVKISGYWKRWGRRIGDTIIHECKISKVVERYIDEINAKHKYHPKVINNEIDYENSERYYEDDEETEDYIDWEDFKNGKEFWSVIQMMIRDNRLTHWEIFKLRIWLGYLFTDIQFLTYENEMNKKIKSKNKSKDLNDLNKKLINSGSTCTSCFIYGLDWKKDDRNHYFYQDNVISRLLIAHVGDTRAIICDKNGLAHSLTKDHHPSNPIESSRLRKLSAGLIMTDSYGEERFLNFANTRSFGDISAKDVGVSAEPEMTEYLIGNSTMLENFKLKNKQKLIDNQVTDFGGDESFIVLVSDGVTNHLSDQEIVDLIMSNFNNRGVDKGNPSKGAEEVIGFVECIGGDDNATCLVIRLGGWGKWPIQDRTGKLREQRMMEPVRNKR
jgi:protein phosphatase PTC6